MICRGEVETVPSTRPVRSPGVSSGAFEPPFTLQKTLSAAGEPRTMVNRRRVLRVGIGGIAATAGCLGTSDGPASDDQSGTTDGTPSAGTPADDDSAPTSTPGDVPDWEPEWTRRFDGRHVLGLDSSDGLLFATVSSEGGPSAVVAVDPDGGSVLWRTESEGEAVGHSRAGDQGIARGQWGVTVADDAVYAVAGPVEEREWSALHALDRASGERRWSLRCDRELGVAGVADGVVVATGLEFFPPADQTPVSHQSPEEPLTTVLYGLDAGDGTVRWRREFAGVRDVAVGPDGSYVAAGNRLVGLDRDGATRFTYDRGPATGVEAAGDRVYYLTGVDETATLHGVAPGGSPDWTRTVRVDELLLDGDRLYAGGDAVVSVDPDGSVVWREDDHGQWLLLDPDGDALYTRSGIRADRATAYHASGGERWSFAPPSNNAWPEAATADALAVTAITADDGPFKTVYAVDGDGRATASLDRGTVFDAVGLDGSVYLADGESNLLALVP